MPRFSCRNSFQAICTLEKRPPLFTPDEHNRIKCSPVRVECMEFRPITGRAHLTIVLHHQHHPPNNRQHSRQDRMHTQLAAKQTSRCVSMNAAMLQPNPLFLVCFIYKVRLYFVLSLLTRLIRGFYSMAGYRTDGTRTECEAAVLFA